jgi:hypothetical protein
MDVGDIRPREVTDVEDDKDQVISNSNVQASGSYDQNQASSSSQVQDQQVASTSSQPNDQPSGVQTRSRLISFYEHFSFM